MMHSAPISSFASRVLAGSLVVLGLTVSAHALGAEVGQPYDGRLAFDVLRGDKQIGHHVITFSEVDDEIHVDIDIELVVKIGFLTVFRYEHQNREVWKNGQVVSVSTDTNDDGKPFEVRAAQRPDGLHVRTLDDENVVPATSIPTSYWNPEILRNKQWLDTQRGIILETEVEKVGVETVALGDGRTIDAERFEITGDLTITVWYTPEGEWVKLAFPARGSDIEYVMTDGYTGTRLTLAE